MGLSTQEKDIFKGFQINWMELCDANSEEILWKSNKDLSAPDVEHEAHVMKKILQCRKVQRKINFSSAEKMERFCLKQKVLFKEHCLEELFFEFGLNLTPLLHGRARSWHRQRVR